MYRYRYSRWDGTQQVFPVHESDLMAQLSEHLMVQGDVSTALRTLVNRGVKGRFGQSIPGLQDLLQRLRDRRQELLNRHNLASVLDDISNRLADVVDTERRGIQHRLDELRARRDASSDPSLADELLRLAVERARRSQEFLDALPSDPAGRIRQLSDYEFMDQTARDKFQQLVDSLRLAVLDKLYKELSQRLKDLTPPRLQRLKEMARELNRLLEQPFGPSKEEFQSFMDRHGGLLGPQPPKSLEELLERMRDQLAQVESLLKSLSPRQRQELEEVLASALQDEELQAEMSRLARNVAQHGPLGSLGRELGFRGDDPLSLEEALARIGEVHSLEELEQQLRHAQQGGDLSVVDQELLRVALGPEALEHLHQLRQMELVLEQAGYIRQVGPRYELTPKGVRRIGERALQELFGFIKRDRLGGHAVPALGQGGDREEQSKPYEPDDEFVVDVPRSLMNALRRRPGTPVRLLPRDLEVYRVQQQVQAATVLMLDLSLSMAMRGNFLAAKKVALALDNLIRTQFPRDILRIVGFSTYAREVDAERLAYLTWDEFDPYTNIQQGLALSRKLLSRTPASNRQIVLISDGEPTAHVEGDQLYLQYPPSQRTLSETLAEVRRCTRLGITINTFMLERSVYLLEFVERMTRINRGRVFYTSPERLGEYILVDYLSARRRLIA